MKKATKIWLITAASLILIGCLIIGGVILAMGFDFTKLSTGKYELTKHEISEDFNDISVNIDTADIIFALSEDGKCSVECWEKEKEVHTVNVKDGVLKIELINSKKWYDYIGINIGSPKITVYLPKSEYATILIKACTGTVTVPKDFKFDSVNITANTGNINFDASVTESVKIKTSTGKINMQNVTAGVIDLSVSTGRVYLNNVKCKNFFSSGNTGDISLNGVIAEEKLTVKRNTGDVELNKSDAAEIEIETTTGKVTGTVLTSKVFIAKSNTGRVTVPESFVGGKCKVTTSTGKIELQIAGN